MFETTLGKMLQPQPASDAEAEAPYIKSMHVQWEGVIFDDLPTMWASPIDIEELDLDIGDLMVCEGGEVGRCAIISTDPPNGCIFQNALHRVRGREKNDVRYLGYCLKQATEAGWFDVLCNRATIAHFTVEKFRELRIHLPYAETQRLIANYLDRETARIDELIAEKERMLALLDEKRSALISRVVTRGLDANAPLKPSGQEWLGEIPAHWDTCQLKRTWASSVYGLSESIKDEGDIGVLRMSCIVDGGIDISKSGVIAEVDSSFLLRRDDLLFNRTNSLDQIAKVGLVDFDPKEPLTFASYLVRIRANRWATPQYLNALLNSTLFLNFARKNAIPAIGQANLSPTRYGEIHIPLPPKAEQEEIVTFLEGEDKISTPVREHIKRSIGLLRERRSALITAAVTGQIPLEEMAQ
jgi:type I restriction enzyme S subunit